MEEDIAKIKEQWKKSLSGYKFTTYVLFVPTSHLEDLLSNQIKFDDWVYGDFPLIMKEKLNLIYPEKVITDRVYVHQTISTSNAF